MEENYYNQSEYNFNNIPVELDEKDEHLAELESMFTEKASSEITLHKSNQPAYENPKQLIKTNSTSQQVDNSNGFSSFSALISITILVSIMTIFMTISIIVLK